VRVAAGRCAFTATPAATDGAAGAAARDAGKDKSATLAGVTLAVDDNRMAS